MNKLIVGLLAAVLVAQVFILVKPSKPANLIVNGGSALGAAAEVTTNWTAGSFSSDLSVGGDLTITGTSTLSGNVSGVPKAISTSMSSSATTTACAVLNSSGSNRVVVAAGVVDRGSAVSVGAVNWTAGTSSYPGVAPAYTKVIANVLTRVSGVDVLSTTSSVMSAYSSWNNGEYFVFQTGTTTNSGTCRLLYY